MPTTVTGTFVTPDGVACTGTVTFQLSTTSYHAGLGQIVTTDPLTETLDGTGSFSIDLEPTDDADWAVTGLSYLVTERVEGGTGDRSKRRYYVTVPTSGAAIDLGDLSTYATAPTINANQDISADVAALDAELAAVEAAASPRHGSGGGRGTVCFTWDDSYSSHYEVVAPAAEARNQRHTFLPHTDAIGTAGRMTSTQLANLAAAGHEIGTHGKTHTDFTGLSVANREIEYAAQQTIDGWIGAGKCRTLAYPYGGKNATIEQETALRFDRTFIVGNVNTPWRQPAHRARSHSLNRLNWTSANHSHVLAAIRSAAITNTTTFVLSHNVADSGGDITAAELIEALDLAESLGVRCTTAADAVPLSNRLIDPGFEDSTLGGWVVTAGGGVTSAADTPDTGMGGTRSLKLSLAGAGYVEAVQSVPLDLVEPYTISGRYRSTQSTGYAKITIRYLDSSNTAVGSDTNVNLGVPVSWTRFTQALTVPAGCVALQVYLFIQTAGDAYFDHLWLAPTHHLAIG